MANDIYFRSALSGYNKNDVINFIEKLNSEQVERVNELNDRLRSAQTEIRKLTAELDEASKKCALLEDQLSESSEQRSINDEKAHKYDNMQESYADIMLEAEHTSKEKVKAAEEKAERLIAEANELKQKVIIENKQIIETTKTDFLALVDKLTSSFDESLSKLGASENE